MTQGTRVAIIAALLVVLVGVYWWSKQVRVPAPGGVACTQEAMLCPDGSYVGRTGPECQFAACSGAASSSASGSVQQPMADGAEGSVIGANVALGTDASAALGTYLIAYNGMTLYTYGYDSGDGRGKSNCYGTCAADWPPYIVRPEDNLSNVKAGVGGAVGTTIRNDGKIQVTYNGEPLYFYIKDTKSGDTNGQGVGGIWFVVKP